MVVVVVVMRLVGLSISSIGWVGCCVARLVGVVRLWSVGLVGWLGLICDQEAGTLAGGEGGG